MKRRPIPSVQEMTTRWVNGMQGAAPRYTAGIQAAVAAGINPGALAAANQQGYLQGVQNNVSKWANNVQRMTPQAWQQLCTQLGANNLGPAAVAKQAKYNAAMQTVAQAMTALKQQISAMPGTTYAQRMARQRAWADGLHALRTTNIAAGATAMIGMMAGS